jgi:hypothetical protein
MYGKYGYNPRQAAAYVLRHISLGRPLNYHSIPPHLYWKNPTSQPASRPAPATGQADPALFVRGDGGWTEGLHPMDRFIKNTCEVLCPLNEISARLQMTRHEFLTADHKTQRTVFGDGRRAVEVVINDSSNPFVCDSKLGGRVELPPFGFLVESPTFAAFHALTWNGLRYDSPPLFTLRSLDDRPLSTSRDIRVYHAFGDDQIRLGKLTRTVKTEANLVR